MKYFDLYKQADSPYHRYFKRSQPKSKEMQERIDLYNYIKKMPLATVKVFHGTSEKIWNAIKQRGYFTSPNARGAGNREARKRGLDEVFFTTSLSYAASYANRSARQDNSTPILLGLEIPIYYFIEISNVILGQNPSEIYNEMSIQYEIANIIKRNTTKEEKYEQINDSLQRWIRNQLWNEFTIKHAVPLRFVKSVRKLKSNQNESNIGQKSLMDFNQFTHEYRAYIIKGLQSGLFFNFQQIPNHMWDDFEVVLEAVKQNVDALTFASKQLKNDKQFMHEAVKQDGDALKHASEQLRNDKDVVLEAVKKSGVALGYASEQLKSDKQVVLEAVKQNGYALQYAPAKLKNDRDFMLAAVKQNGFAFQFASEQLKNDRDFMIEAVKHNIDALFYASEQLQNDEYFMLEAVKQKSQALAYASEQLKNDRDFMLEVVKHNIDALYYASEQLKNDEYFMLEAVKQKSQALAYAGEELINYRDFILECVKQNVEAVHYASYQLKNDPNFMDEVNKIRQQQRNATQASGWYQRIKVADDANIHKTIGDLDADQAYETFRKSYEDSVGTAWTKDKFIGRSQNWRFYGDNQGYVTVREQNSGMFKLTGVAGSPKSILKGVKDLLAENRIIWGMVSEDIANMATRVGFRQVPAEVVKQYIQKIPSYVFGGAEIKRVNDDGGVEFLYSDVGAATKYLIGNDMYINFINNSMNSFI